jgi:hypothetical protein
VRRGLGTDERLGARLEQGELEAGGSSRHFSDNGDGGTAWPGSAIAMDMALALAVARFARVIGMILTRKVDAAYLHWCKTRWLFDCAAGAMDHEGGEKEKAQHDPPPLWHAR